MIWGREWQAQFWGRKGEKSESSERWHAAPVALTHRTSLTGAGGLPTPLGCKGLTSTAERDFGVHKPPTHLHLSLSLSCSSSSGAHSIWVYGRQSKSMSWQHLTAKKQVSVCRLMTGVWVSADNSCAGVTARRSGTGKSDISEAVQSHRVTNRKSTKAVGKSSPNWL